MFFHKLLLKLKPKKRNLDNSYFDKKASIWKPILMLIPGLIALCFFIIYPLFVTVDYAFHPLANSHKANSSHFGFDAFKAIINDTTFSKSVSNSLLYALISVPLSLVISLTIASIIASFIRKITRGFWQTIFFLPYVATAVSVAIAFVFLFGNEYGIINRLFNLKVNWLKDPTNGSKNALVVMIVNGIWMSFSFEVIVFTSAILGIDKQKYQAASLDGAGALKQFFYITLPSISKTISFVLTVGLISSIKVMPLALYQNNYNDAMNYGGSTIMMYIYWSINQSSPAFHTAAAATIILISISIGFNLVIWVLIITIDYIYKKGGERRLEKKIKIGYWIH